MKNKKIEFETFKDIGFFEINNLKQDEPSCFNGFVSVNKYKIIIEEIEEDYDVICERIKYLWENSNNFHDAASLTRIASRYNLKLDPEKFRSKNK